ncbi:30S ribosomal protein S17 [Patescibacteria group bacterium]
MNNQEKIITKKKLKGKVVSDKMDKTIVVSVNRFYKQKKYGKFISTSKKYKVHDEKGEFKVGDRVIIEECRPLSKDKHFTVMEDKSKTKNQNAK